VGFEWHSGEPQRSHKRRFRYVTLCPMRTLLTADLIRSLRFDRRPSGVDADGQLIYDADPLPSTVRDWSIRDTQLPGFGVRLTQGSKTFFVQRKRGGTTSDRYVLTDQHSLKAARAQAQAWLARMARGEDPRRDRADANSARLKDKERAAMTFAVVFDAYATGGVGLREGTVADRALASRWLAQESIAGIPLYKVSRADVHATFAPMMMAADKATAARKAPGNTVPRKRGGGPHADVASAWKLLRHCSAAWNATEADKGPANPFTAWRREHRKTLPKVARRETALPTDREAGVAWLKALLALRDAPDHATAVVADYLVCVLLWGGRRSEIQTLCWQDVSEHEGAVLFREELTKTRRNLWLPLAPWAKSILEERRKRNGVAGFPAEAKDWVFPSVFKGRHIVEIRDVQQRLREASGLWIGPHDLRRTMASDIFGDTRDLRTVGMVLGHATSEGDVSAGYVPDRARLRALRPLYENRERDLRRIAGVEAATDPLAHLTDKQRIVMEAAESMLRAAGITPDAAAATLGTRR